MESSKCLSRPNIGTGVNIDILLVNIRATNFGTLMVVLKKDTLMFYRNRMEATPNNFS